MARTFIKRAGAAVFAAILAGGLGASPAAAQAGAGRSLTIVTGAEQGTYFRFGIDMRDATKADGVEVEVVESRGSLINAFAVRYSPNVQMGVVQSDVRDYLLSILANPASSGLSRDDEAELRGLVDNLVVVKALYIEELHLIARSDIESIEDLAGKVVSVGAIGSGTFITATNLFDLLGVEVEAATGFGPAGAIDALRKGVVDAMVYVVGQPAAALAELSAEDGFRILPIEDDRLFSAYELAEIQADSYPWWNETTRTIGVRSLLVSYNYAGENCALIGDFARSIEANLDVLRSNGHPKWRDVRFDSPVGGWSRYGCVGGDAPMPTSTPAAVTPATAPAADPARPAAPSPSTGGGILDIINQR